MTIKNDVEGMENYISSAIIMEYPDISLDDLEGKELGIKFISKYEYNKEKSTWTLQIDTVVADDSPEWLQTVLNMCITQISYGIEDYGVELFKFFMAQYTTSQSEIAHKDGDFYLNILLHDKVFMFHMPLHTAMHMCTEEQLLRMKKHPKHYWCREAITELDVRERYRRNAK